MSVLDLTHKWHFEGMKHIALESLKTSCRLTDLEKIRLARTYKTPSYAKEAVENLIKQTRTLSDQQCKALGWKLAARVGQCREGRLKRHHQHIISARYCPYNRQCRCCKDIAAGVQQATIVGSADTAFSSSDAAKLSETVDSLLTLL